jgi:hypothetical protein
MTNEGDGTPCRREFRSMIWGLIAIAIILIITTVRSITGQIRLVIVRDAFGTVGFLENHRLYRSFFECCHRKYLHQCVERHVRLQPLPDDGDQHVDRQGDLRESSTVFQRPSRPRGYLRGNIDFAHYLSIHYGFLFLLLCL